MSWKDCYKIWIWRRVREWRQGRGSPSLGLWLSSPQHWTFTILTLSHLIQAAGQEAIWQGDWLNSACEALLTNSICQVWTLPSLMCLSGILDYILTRLIFLNTPLDTHVDGTTILVLTWLKYNCDIFVCCTNYSSPFNIIKIEYSPFYNRTKLSSVQHPSVLLGNLSNWKSWQVHSFTINLVLHFQRGAYK